jgi:two-component system cell cycle response regulator
VLNEGNPGPGVQLTMNPRFGNFFESLWSRPDPVLADAGVAGELLVAKIRLSLATVLLLIPVINSLFFPVDPKEGLVGLSLTSGTFVLALTVYLMISRGYNSSWLRFASSAFDVTLVSSALVLFLLLNQPHTAVNSKVVFEGYFLVIGSASLRYDDVDDIGVESGAGLPQPETFAAGHQRPSDGPVQSRLRGRPPRDRA